MHGTISFTRSLCKFFLYLKYFQVYDYTPDKLEADVEAQRASKANEPQQAEEEEDKMNESGAKDWSGLTDSAEASQYHVGDFVYVTPEDPGLKTIFFYILTYELTNSLKYAFVVLFVIFF